MEELSKLEKQGYTKPKFELDGQILKITIYRGSSIGQVSNGDLKGLKELKEHKVLTSGQYIDLTRVSERTARRHLNDLVKAGKAKKQGDGPTTEYQIIER